MVKSFLLSVALIVCLAALGAWLDSHQFRSDTCQVPIPTPRATTWGGGDAPTERDVFTGLQSASAVELYSIEPGQPGPGCVHKVLGSVRLSRAERSAVVDSILTGIRSSDGLEAGCFHPRHGLVAGQYVLLICYECAQVYAWKLSATRGVDFNDQKCLRRKWLTSAEPARVLNEILVKHAVPLPRG